VKLKEVADLRYPSEWYPATREIPRTIHMHVGPTNSGKTYHALKRLEEVESGIYLGPLRLLAHEVYTRLNAKGKACALITGEEQRMPEGDRATMFSCTVEMAPLNTKFDVAVIDEIQMINHRDRGWAWTQAFLGLQAKEIHLCGEARTVPLMRELCALVGDKVHVHEYERLTPLGVLPRSLQGKLSRLEKGDCIVAFTVLGIHALRREIEKRTGKKCAIVYGSLPPETRAQQARLFNDPDNDYDFLVASDAIGMGLNL
jgi:ATP-dependent RNA helicase SUPV3L1/SUV3